MPIERALESAKHPQEEAKPQEAAAKAKPDPDEAPKQRAVILPSGPVRPPPLQNGKRVRVYHKRRTTLHLTDCKLGPNEERDILESDARHPNVARYVVRLAP